MLKVSHGREAAENWTELGEDADIASLDRTLPRKGDAVDVGNVTCKRRPNLARVIKG